MPRAQKYGFYDVTGIETEATMSYVTEAAKDEARFKGSKDVKYIEIRILRFNRYRDRSNNELHTEAAKMN